MEKETEKRYEREIEPVDLNNLEEMIALGYRNPLEPRDESVWTKTPTEKEVLKKTRKLHKNYKFSTSWAAPVRSIPCYGQLIIELKKDPAIYRLTGIKKENFKGQLTRSIHCGQAEIQEILNRYIGTTKENGEIVGTYSLIKKYKWNGRWYKPTELPFYYW